MTPKQIFDSKADKDQIDSQASADTKSRRRLIFPKRGTGSSNKTGPSPEPTDGQETDKDSDAAVKSRLDGSRIMNIVFRKRNFGSSNQQADVQETGTMPDDMAENKSDRRRIQIPVFRKKKEFSPAQQEGPDGQEKEDSVEVDAQPVEKKESIFQDVPEKFSEIIGKILPEDQDDLLTRELLSYLNERLESGEDPDWDYITCGSDSGAEKFLLPVHQKYITNYLLGNLLKADYIEGFVVEDDGNSKRLRMTTGIQITANGRKRLKELTGMGRITALLRIIKDCTPGM